MSSPRPWLLAALLLVPVATSCSDGRSARRPNVVLIVVDTLRADVLDGSGVEARTPNIDAFAAEGIAFRRTYSHAPMTLPSHTALFSSQSPIESGVLNNWQSVPEDLPLLPEQLSRFGYSTRAVISLGTLSPPADNPGLTRGFEVYDKDFFMLDKAEDVQPRLQQRLREWPAFAADDGQPFFLFAHYCDPHEPYRSHLEDDAAGDSFAVVELDGRELDRLRLSDAPNVQRELELEPGEHRLRIEVDGDASMLAKVIQVKREGGGRLAVEFTEGGNNVPLGVLEARFEVEEAGPHAVRYWLKDTVAVEEARRRYLEEVEHADRFVGQLLQELRDSGQYDETLVVFASDHGEALGERGFIGHVEYLNDVMIRVPLIIKPPKSDRFAERLGARRDDPVSLIDVAPTILEICQVPAMETQRGESLLREERERPFEHVAGTHKPESRTDRMSLFDGTLRMVYVLDEDRYHLYDLTSDPREEHDVFEERKDERPDWPARLKLLAERAVALTAGGGREPSGRSEMLDALGY